MFVWMTVAAMAIGCVVVLHTRKQVLSSQTSHPLPPGPPGLPWVGNVIGIDTDAPWKTYAKWAKTYGDIMYSRLLGKDIIIINSLKVAKDLLETRSKNYSDRPYLITNELFLPLMHRKTCDILRRLIGSPENLEDHVFEYTTSVILNNTYDYNPESRKDELMNKVSNVLNIVVPAVRPDVSVVVGAFPFLLYLPSWLPGMSFKRNMEIARMHAKQYLDGLFEHALQRSKESGNVEPCMVHDALQGVEEKGILPEESWMKVLKEASGTVLLEKAQEQIDSVVGKKRLPTTDDRAMLPLLDAILCETLRLHPVVPLSLPHAVVDDDVYDGFHIPKGAIVLPNVWSMTRDESTYPNSDAFIPERFLNEDGSLKPNDINDIIFGFGRRICPGRYYADASIWSVIAGVLAVFKILKPLDENGMEITIDGRFSSGISVYPLPFKCRIEPRFSFMDHEINDGMDGKR